METLSVDSIEKKTLILRLAVTIYKMTDEQLDQLLKGLDQEGYSAPDRKMNESSLSGGLQGQSLQRQTLIARLFVLITQMDTDILLGRLKKIDHPGFNWWREFPRMDCHLMVDFVVQGKAYRGYLRDISAGGSYIATSDKFKIDQEVSLCFILDESHENLVFKLTGRISQLYNDGIGVQYHDITHLQQSTIDAVVQKKISS